MTGRCDGFGVVFDESPNYITLPLVEQPQVVIDMIWLDPGSGPTRRYSTPPPKEIRRDFCRRWRKRGHLLAGTATVKLNCG
jgi:hypothetical protein